MGRYCEKHVLPLPISLAALVAIMLLGTPSARADLLGSPSEVPSLSQAEQSLLKRNPDLELLSRSSPWLLRRVLTSLPTLPRDAGRDSRPLDGMSDYEVWVLGRNPTLMQVYQSSPAAVAELLALIRAAGNGGKKGE